MWELLQGERLKIYGGPKNQDQSFYSKTFIDVANMTKGQVVEQKGEVMAFSAKELAWLMVKRFQPEH